MPLRIDRVKIVNYRNFLDFEIENFPPSAVIVGENEAGKSNFIRALRLALDPDMPAVERKLDEQDVSSFSDGVSRGASVTIEVDLVGFDSDEVLGAILGDFCIETMPYKARLTYVFKPSADATVLLSESDETGEGNAAPTQSDYKISDYDWQLYGAGDPARGIQASELQRVAIQLVGALRDAEGELASARRRNPGQRS